MGHPVESMSLNAEQIARAIESWLNAEFFKIPVKIKDYTFSGYDKGTQVYITLADVAPTDAAREV